MSKKNKKNNRLNVFTEEELKDLELNDDGVLEVSFGENDSANKKNVSQNKGKQKVGASVKKTSEIDKRVAAILKKLDIENDDDPEEEDDGPMASDTFDNLMKKVKQKMTEKIDNSMASSKEMKELKKKFKLNDDGLDDVRSLASQYYSGIGMDQNFNCLEIEDLENELEDTDDRDEKARIRRKIKKLEKENKRLMQIINADAMVRQYNMLDDVIEEKENQSVSNDIRNLYEKYGKEAIRELLTYEMEEEEAI